MCQQRNKSFGTYQTVPQQANSTMLGVIQDITERKQLEWQLEHQANSEFSHRLCQPPILH
jgi:hypothetical protein